MAYRIHSAPDDYRHDSEQRECARGERCASATVVRLDDGTYLRQAALGYRTMCEIDRAFVLRSIEQMPDYHAELFDRLGDKTSSHGPKVSGSRSAPLPVNVTYEALLGEIEYLVPSWALRVAILADLQTGVAERRSRAYWRLALTPLCVMLAEHLDALLGLDVEPMNRFMGNTEVDEIEGAHGVHRIARNYYTGVATVTLDRDGADAGLEFLQLNARCRWMLGLTGADEEIHVPCEVCELKGTVVRPDGAAGLADFAECRACGARYFGAQYANLMRDAYEREIARQQVNRQAS